MAFEPLRQDLRPQPALHQEVRAVPGVLQTLGMLALTHQEVADATERALAENPVLERAEGHPCPGCGRHVPGGLCARCRARGAGRALREQTEAGTDPFRGLEAQAGLEVRAECRHIVPLLLGHLTERGLLDSDPQQIAALHGLGLAQVEEALRAVKAAGPAGIAERDVAALLAAQAEALAKDRQVPPWLPRLVREHLTPLGEGRLRQVAEDMGLTQREVEHGLALIRSRLRPFAIPDAEPDKPPAQPADVFLYRRADGTLEVEVPTSSWFGLRVADLAQGLEAAGEARHWLAAHELAARQLIRQVDSRADVLLRVARYAAEFQREFLDHGPAAHRPLTRTAVAGELGLHPSTVSRAVRAKRLRLPHGAVVDLACLFGKGVAARNALQELMSSDGAGTSDAALREELSLQGIQIARRTVTKYRHALASPGPANRAG